MAYETTLPAAIVTETGSLLFSIPDHVPSHDPFDAAWQFARGTRAAIRAKVERNPMVIARSP
jgi:hypothetical protein